MNISLASKGMDYLNNLLDKALPQATTNAPTDTEEAKQEKYEPNSPEWNNSQLTDNPLSYYTLIRDRRRFIRAGTRGGDEFNIYDNPTRVYFKIVFYFWNPDVDSGNSYTGLLAPTWMSAENPNPESLFSYAGWKTMKKAEAEAVEKKKQQINNQAKETQDSLNKTQDAINNMLERAKNYGQKAWDGTKQAAGWVGEKATAGYNAIMDSAGVKNLKSSLANLKMPSFNSDTPTGTKNRTLDLDPIGAGENLNTAELLNTPSSARADMIPLPQMTDIRGRMKEIQTNDWQAELNKPPELEDRDNEAWNEISEITMSTIKETSLEEEDNAPYWMFDSAWSYLMNNNELERADLLKQFINLLSNISSESPWYFQEVSGLEDALKRTYPFSSEPKRLSIKCLKDAVDNRIGTLMDLYRAIVWSWQRKCEIVPSNLRKFDMGIFIYSTPIKPLHHSFRYLNLEDGSTKKEELYAQMFSSNDSYRTSYKYIEFHNCEFDYNSATSGLNSVKNDSGTEPEYTISITYDDCYEERYNEFMMKYIGDMIEWDSIESTENMSDFNKKTINIGLIPDLILQQRLAEYMRNNNTSALNLANVNKFETKYAQQVWKDMHAKIEKYNSKNKDIKEPSKSGIVSKFLKRVKKEYVDPVIDVDKIDSKITNKVNTAVNTMQNEFSGFATKYLNSKLTRALFGNVNTFSIPKIAEQLTNLSKGRIFETADAVKSYTEKNSRKTLSWTGVGKYKKVHKNFGYTGEPLGNLYKARTAINNT